MNLDTPRCPPASELAPLPSTDEAANQLLARLAKGLAHPARVAILRLLLRRDSCVCGEIVDELPLAQSTISQHLKQLKQAGLVRGTVDGPRVCYCVERAALADISRLVAQLT